MDFINSNIVSAFVSLLLAVVILLLPAILYNVRYSKRTKIQELENRQRKEVKEKEPEEHDERFATGRYLCTLLKLLYLFLCRRH